MRFAVTVQGRTQHHVLVGAGPDTPLGQTAAAIAEAVAEPGTDLYQGSRRLDPQATLAEAGLYEGATVSFEPRQGPAIAPPPLLELHTVSGVGAGAIHPLAAGRHAIGSAETSAIRVAGAAPLAAELTVTPDGLVHVLPREGAALATVSAPADAAVTPASGEPAVPVPAPAPASAEQRSPVGGPGALPWPLDADLVVGETVLRWLEPEPSDSSVQPTEDGVELDFNQPPRIIKPVPQQRHRIPQRPVYRGRNPFPMLMIIMPAVMGIGITRRARGRGWCPGRARGCSR